MKLAVLFTVASAVSADEWEAYKQQFGKVYNGGDEDTKRKGIFVENKKQWGQHPTGAILGATQFSDLTLEEFQQMPIRGMAPMEKSDLPKTGVHKHNGETLAASVDWTTKGAVTPVKNQGQCGSCWAFSTTGGLEGSWEISTGNLVSMSEQFFVDCSKQNSGCNGGLMDKAFSFAEGVAVATEDSYPYTAKDGSCKSSFTTAIPQGGVTGYSDVGVSASDLQSALQKGPVSVAIEADQAVFQQYTGGTITSGCGTNLDHGVLAVGYTGSAIKVKNSWGSSWGDAGYVHIDASQCGITTAASFPKTSGSSEWEGYKQQFGKVYNGVDEDAKRQTIFEENKKQWGQHESGAILGATVFSDLTVDEFKAQNIRGWQNTEKSDLPKVGVHKHNGEKLAASVDWTTKGAVTPVKNQGQCGSCWAFSSTGGLEGSWEISTGNLVSMSEQFFVDCSKQNSGCNGGLMDYAFKFAEGVAVATEDSYPYTASDGSCKSSYTTAIPAGGVTGFQDVGVSASDLQSALQKGPVSVAIEADQAVFQQYTGGTITSGCGTNLDHGVLAVGYDGSAIKVKNSWGSSWGVNGYVNIAADQCGITTSASFPKTSGSSIQV